MEIINIKDNFKEEVEDYNGITIVDFWATWCGPCKMFAKVFENASKKFEFIKFCKLNVDEDSEDISKKLGVMSIPTTIIFKNGKEIKRNIGFISEDDLAELLGDI